MAIHDAAAQGYKQRSGTYAAARPSHHPDVVAAVAAAIGDGLVIDLGAGTGISTLALVDHGLEVLAVEPVAAMRSEFAKLLPDVTVVDGTAESIPCDNGSAAGVVVAQAFHWFDHGPALEEIARVLRPGGLLVTLWNVRDESVPWMAAWTEVVDQFADGTPRYRDMAWRRTIEADGRFELADEVETPNPQRASTQKVVDRALSVSFIARLDAADQERVEQQIRAVVAKAGLVDPFDFPYRAEAQLWRFA